MCVPCCLGRRLLTVSAGQECPQNRRKNDCGERRFGRQADTKTTSSATPALSVSGSQALHYKVATLPTPSSATRAMKAIVVW